MTTPTLPSAFVDQIRLQLGEQADAFLATYADSPSYALRINPAKTTLSDLAHRTGWNFDPVPWCPTGAYLDPANRPGTDPFHAAGLFYLQEPSAMAVAEFANLTPGETVLDLAASPGGKSTQIASAIGPTGLLVSNEIHPARIKPLGENLERWGATNAIIANNAPESLAQVGPLFDCVVVDAPCSGEGLFRRDPAARLEWSPERVRGSAERQVEILTEAVKLVRPGGTLIYSTCTFNEIENEQVVNRILASHPDFRLDASQRLWPHEVRGEGHTMARLIHSGEIQSDWHGYIPHLPYGGDLWRTFVDQNLLDDPTVDWPGDLIERNGRLTCAPNTYLTHLVPHQVRSGLWLGDAKPGRFEPSHALALAIDPALARNRLDLTVAEARQWIAGNPVQHGGSSGWVLITVEGFGLGWGKRTGATVKNHYPKGLRRPV